LAAAAGSNLTAAGELRVPKVAAALVTLAAVGLTMACLHTEYYPVLNGRQALAAALYGLEQRQFRDAEPKAVAAAEADSMSPEPWRLLADLKLARWQATGEAKDWESFVEVADTFRRLDPRHHIAWYTRGGWFLTAWKKSQRKEDLEQAISAYAAASQHYPNRALYHAQLAWVLHLADNQEAASAEAEKALELDQKMPHKEQKLNRQHVFDPDSDKDRSSPIRDESAEQTAQRLRTASAEQMP